jgi:DNA mismatch endonuclease (patch repair protein)
MPKFDRNVRRDKVVTRTLRNAGWAVVRVWECELASRSSNIVRRIRRTVASREPKC